MPYTEHCVTIQTSLAKIVIIIIIIIITTTIIIIIFTIITITKTRGSKDFSDLIGLQVFQMSGSKG